MRLVHLTDLHLSNLHEVKYASLLGKRWSGYLSWQKNRRKHHRTSVIEEMFTSIKAENADQILVTGDLVQIGLREEIEQATEWLRLLGPVERVMVIPGNHDVYAAGSEAAVLDEWGEYMFHGAAGGDHGAGAGFPVMRKLNGLSLIGISSACVTPVFMARGKLGRQQLQKLDHLLEQATREQQLVCLLIHHPPLPGMARWRKALADTRALESLLDRYPPNLIFHGHLHHNRDEYRGDTRIFCTASASSISDASYRVIELENHGGITEIRMELKSISIDSQDRLEFALDECNK